MTDDELANFVDDIDNFLLNKTQQYNLEPLNMIGVVLARMSLVAKATGSIDDYFRLLDAVKFTVDADTNTESVVH